MKYIKIIFSCLLFFLLYSREGASFEKENSHVQRDDKIIPIDFISYESLTPVNQQITCSHLIKRLKYTDFLLEEFYELVRSEREILLSKDNMHSHFFSRDSFRYLIEKLDINKSVEFSKKTIQVVGFLPHHRFDLTDKAIDGVGGVIFGDYEIVEDKTFDHLPILLAPHHDGYTIRVKLSIGEICLSPKIKFFILKGCEKDKVIFSTCNKEDCLKMGTFDWKTCQKKERLEIDLSTVVKSYGVNGRGLKRKTNNE